jgi:dUTP pyrophosphatase
MKLKIKKLDPRAVMPQYATDGAGAFDLVALPGETFKAHPCDHGAAMYRTGLAFEVPRGHVMLIFSRSGHGFNDAIRLSNCVGVIDSDYRGEVKVSLRADGYRSGKIGGGDRMAQAMLVKIPSVEFEEVEELSDTARGAGGFGSTGVK